ncbi:MAG: hypothetical protein D6734_07635 [Candidatus Schekmanbacteria bacterium]|nr:MAG: hypothetical protein D6734_07635 [Candidatus Schekmanbacteria bacterium]
MVNKLNFSNGEIKNNVADERDKILLKNTAKGDLQFEIRISSITLDNEENIDRALKLQEYALNKIKQMFPNSLILKE